jgi:alkylation response protein AidB-like acyl-CoA dehydrogenase
MKLHLTSEQLSSQTGFAEFVDREVVPYADEFHRTQELPPALIHRVGELGYLGLTLPVASGGGGRDMMTLGLLAEELGRGCSSLRSLLTVHTMVAHAILRWGTAAQKQAWLPALCSGKLLGAFALTEPNVGSDSKSIETTATKAADGYVLRGIKQWITFGQLADLFLVFTQCEGRPAAFLVERHRPGLTTTPIADLLGTRASMVARVQLADCVVPAENLIGRLGFGISHIGASALDLGRYTVAWGCVGIAQACLLASLGYTQSRKQFGVALRDHQLVRQLVTDMMTDVAAARLMCSHAGRLRDLRDEESLEATAMAKYHASCVAARAANSAVQLHGANGCSASYSVGRYYCDAKIMEIIEGSSQIQQNTIAEYGYQSYVANSSAGGGAANHTAG